MLDCCKDQMELHLLKNNNVTIEKLKELFLFSDLKAKIVLEQIKNVGSCLALVESQDKIVELTKRLALQQIGFEVRPHKLIK